MGVSSLLIEDYALVGDCETAALVGRDGSIDWLCFPRFDSGACFAALLGDSENGRWLLSPKDRVLSSNRQYRPDTLILETEFETESGAVKIIDWMPPRSTTAAPDLFRMAVGTRGRVTMRMELRIRFDYGLVVPWVHRTRQGDIQATAGPDSVLFRTKIEHHGEDFRTLAEFPVSEGQRITFELAWFPTYGRPPEESDVEESLRKTEAWWRQWSQKCTYQGEWREAVIRSFITLKALTYGPTGGVVAAATTSLPEKVGGVRNWDYRYCWIRDASFTLYALASGGYIEEAEAWRKWLVNAVAGKPSGMHIMYGLAGERRLPELELDWLSGYEGSKPVRTGNTAHTQFQLDVYGEMMNAMYVAQRAGLPLSLEAWRIQLALLEFLQDGWKKTDHGIWEMRGPRRHFTHSKVMAWLAFDRGIRSVEEFGYKGPLTLWRSIREKIHDEVCRNGFDAGLNSFVQYYGAKHVDASLLMIPLVGFLPPDDARVRGTIDAVQNRLMRNGFVDRYPTMPEVDGLPAGEGAFFICTFWLVDNLVLLNRYQEAKEKFEGLLQLRNDVGLMAEEYDPNDRRFLGNYPQAFSHVGLINAAFILMGSALHPKAS
jgi:GH15 family glucan-1,4-alpha-glucosidase